MPFDKEKEHALRRRDRSQKGSIDPEMIPLCDALNHSLGYYTTSSCSGRIVIIQAGIKKADAEWLLASHSAVSVDEAEHALRNMGKRPVWLKAESFILHVVCRDISWASSLLGLTQSIGLKRSGITTLNNRIMIEILSSESLEAPIAKDGKMIISRDALTAFLDEANRRLLATRSRLEHLTTLIRRTLASKSLGQCKII